MKRKLLLLVSATLLAVTGSTVPSLAADDDGPLLPGRWMPDYTAYDMTSWDGNLHEQRLQKAQPGDRVTGWWWQRTTNQNSIIEHMNSDSTTSGVVNIGDNMTLLRRPDNGDVQIPPTGGAVPITDGGAGTNSVIVETTNYVILIGVGGNTTNSHALKHWIADNIGKPIRYVIVPDTGYASWRDLATIYTPGQPLTIFMALSFLPAFAHIQATNPSSPGSTAYQRFAAMNGWSLPRDTDWRLNVPLPAQGSPLLCSYGPYQFPTIPGVDCNYVTQDGYSTVLDGQPVVLTTPIDEIGALTVYFPTEKAVIPPSLFGGYLPDIAPLNGSPVPSNKVLHALDDMVKFGLPPYLGVDSYLSLHDQPRTGTEAMAAIQAQRTVLQALLTYTLNGLKNNVSVDDLVAGVTLPQSVKDQCAQFEPASPCSELQSSLGFVVKGLYNEYMGSFDGQARSLGTHLNATEQAQILVDVAGGADALLAIAKKAQAAAQDLKSVERVLFMIEPLYQLSPTNADVRLVYFQALYKAGLMQKNNQLRNYYLTLAWAVKPM